MCLISRPQENKSTIVVMSSGGSKELSSTPSSSSPHQSSSLSLGGKTESSERLRGEVASFDAVSLESEVGELKKESAQSAFEITSVEPAPDDDLDTTGRGQPASMDDSTLRMKLESGSEEDTVSLVEEQQTPSMVLHDVDQAASGGGLASSSAVDLTRMHHHSASGNGPSVQPGGGRFRKVNKYTRGRWTVRDMETTEERSGSDPSRHSSQGGSKMNVFEMGSPSVSRKAEQLESLHSRSGSELGQASGTSVAGAADNISDKDSTHLDRSSTAAETLSRNTSLSSINAPDERTTDVDIDTTVMASGGELSEAVASYPAPQTSTATVTSETSMTTSSGQIREQPVSQLNGPLDSTPTERQIPKSGNPVKEAMAHLQKQLDALLSSKTGMEEENTQLQEKVTNLTEEVETLKTENTRLQQLIEESPGGQQASSLQEKNRLLQEENNRLKTELLNLRSALSLLVQKGSDNSVASTSASHGGNSQT